MFHRRCTHNGAGICEKLPVKFEQSFPSICDKRARVDPMKTFSSLTRDAFIARSVYRYIIRATRTQRKIYRRGL